MDEAAKARCAARARVIKALGHPSRLMIVEELARGPRCVCDLRDVVGSDMSTVSKHLSVLREAGLVDDDKRGLQVFYRLRVPCILNFFGCIEAVLQETARSAQAVTAKRG